MTDIGNPARKQRISLSPIRPVVIENLAGGELSGADPLTLAP
jgi:hypothetical protein